MKKVCNVCGEEKPHDHFHKATKAKDGLSCTCKPCRNAYSKRWREQNPTYQIDLRKNNLEQIRARDSLYYATVTKPSEMARTKTNIARSIRRLVQNKTCQETAPIIKIIGCACEEFIEHIEAQFEEGMSWENRAEWHIDHIIPISYAKTIADVYTLNYHKNLRPLWIHKNMAKMKSLPDNVEELFFNLQIRKSYEEAPEDSFVKRYNEQYTPETESMYATISATGRLIFNKLFGRKI